MGSLDNAAPALYPTTGRRETLSAHDDEGVHDPIDVREVFDHLKGLKDPEHPLSLEALNVVQEALISVEDSNVTVLFKPTIPHCSMAALIGLSICVKLKLVLPSSLKVTVRLAEGSHSSEDAINKQLADKERVAASLENPRMMAVIGRSLRGL